MGAITLATEASRYLNTIDLFRSLAQDIEWRSEADEVGELGAPRRMQPEPERRGFRRPHC